MLAQPTPDVHQTVADLGLKAARPLVWHDRKEGWPKALRGGTCFFLRFEHGLVGLTANHVIQSFEKALVETPSLVCQLRTVVFDLLASIIDRDEHCDLATFRISEDQFTATEAIAFDCRGSWPPPTPEHLRALSLCGFPEHMRITTADRTTEFQAWGALAAVEDVTRNEIIITYDPARDQPTQWAPRMPPLGLNLSGCSGGPVVMHGTRNGLHRWFPVGLIIGGPRDQGEGDASTFDMIRVKRIHRVRPDGKIERESSGWLPR